MYWPGAGSSFHGLSSAVVQLHSNKEALIFQSQDRIIFQLEWNTPGFMLKSEGSECGRG
jgi:hypothetical protein